MVKSVEVKNFKSIVDLKLELGRVNIFIGENGSGKSNILEAVAFGAAASANKLDKEFLASRGMRVPEPKLMRSAFSKDNLDKDVELYFQITRPDNNKPFISEYKLKNSNEDFAKWEDRFLLASREVTNLLLSFFESLPQSDLEELLWGKLKDTVKSEAALEKFKNFKAVIPKAKEVMPDFDLKNSIDEAWDETVIDFDKAYQILNKYKIFAPENTFLRKFEDEDAGDPLGIKGEGLFRLLRYFQNHEDKKYIETINEALSTLDWFDSFDISNDLYPGERRLSIVDRFLDSDVSISQNSANEGFLFILFYISLFVSEDAPSFFAIDNIDASFNPKLCKHITQILVNTAKKTNKQALFTTHNPFILDGLDLTDDEQRLFVVYRSQQGHTIAKRVMPNDRKMSLSEQWMKGYLGGLPQNF